jgi:hypothetical protein
LPGCETNHEGERRHPSCTAQRTAHLDEIFEGVRQVEHTPIEPRCEVHVCQQPCASIGLMNQLTMTYITSRLPHATINTLYHTRQPAPCTTYDNHLTAPHATGSTLHHIRQSAYCTLQHTRQAAQHTAYGQQSAHRALQTTVSTPRISYDNEHTASHTTVSTLITYDSRQSAHCASHTTASTLHHIRQSAHTAPHKTASTLHTSVAAASTRAAYRPKAPAAPGTQSVMPEANHLAWARRRWLGQSPASSAVANHVGAAYQKRWL